MQISRGARGEELGSGVGLPAVCSVSGPGLRFLASPRHPGSFPRGLTTANKGASHTQKWVNGVVGARHCDRVEGISNASLRFTTAYSEPGLPAAGSSCCHHCHYERKEKGREEDTSTAGRDSGSDKYTLTLFSLAAS